MRVDFKIDGKVFFIATHTFFGLLFGRTKERERMIEMNIKISIIALSTNINVFAVLG